VERVDAGGCPAVWMTPGGLAAASPAAPQRVVMWVHGGAFILCNAMTNARLLSSVGAEADARVLSVEYPLAPEADYAGMLAAVRAAYDWLVDPAGGAVDPGSVVGNRITARYVIATL
jgi:monoterpene epsilon-lactone hydrolase